MIAWLWRLLPRRLAGYAWAAPVSLLGVLMALLARSSGGMWRRHEGVLEAAGGWTGWLLQHALPGFPIAAITLGHVVLARNDEWLTRTRRHERVHVAQYTRWGLLFPLAYVIASLLAWLAGRPAYRGNCFEIEAYRVDDPGI